MIICWGTFADTLTVGRTDRLILGRYEVVRELGKGAMGLVYLAKDPLIGRLVALKTIRAVPSSDDDEAREYQQRFLREAQAAGILNHPAIVTVHDIGQDQASGTSFIAMEYVDGPTLKELVQQGRKLPVEELAEIIAQVAEALDYAHSKGIIHRDVKPANILLLGEGRAKITDFGIAKIASAVSNLTTTGQFIGTPNYMAPEQVKGTPVDGRSDIFSLGIVLYECLTGRKPFGGDSLTTISYKIVHDTFTPIRDINPDVPEPYERVVSKCLAKDPADRWQRGRDLAAALRAIVRPNTTNPAYEKALSDRTIVDKETVLTMEMPFPEAAEPMPESPASEEGPFHVDATPRMPRPPKAARKPVDWRAVASRVIHARIPPPVFFAVILIALAAVGARAMSIWNERADEVTVDVGREQLVAKQRELRLEGAAFIQAGNVEGAYRKYKALQELAPTSPFVNRVVSRLEQIRTQKVVSQQRIIDAQAKFEEGKAAFERKDYESALTLLEEAYYLNPNHLQAPEYLRMTREALSSMGPKASIIQPLDARPSSKKSGSTRPSARGSRINEVARQVSAHPSALMTTVKGNATDGYIAVKLDGHLLLQENLFEERRGVVRRRVTRTVSSYKEVRPLSLEVEVLVVVPNARINERKVYRQTFRSGIVHQLNVTVDASNRRVNVDLK